MRSKESRLGEAMTELMALFFAEQVNSEKWKGEGAAIQVLAQKIRDIANEPEPEPSPFAAQFGSLTPVEERTCDHQSHIFGDSGPIKWNPYKKIFMCFLCGQEFVEKKQGEVSGEPCKEKESSP